MPCFPRAPSTSLLLVNGILCLLIFPYPLLYTSFLIVSLEGYLNYFRILPESDIRLNSSHQIYCSFIDSDESSIVKLSKSKEPQNTNGSWVKLIDTTDSDNKSDFGLSGYMNLTSKLCVSTGVDFGLISFSIWGFILLNSLQQFCSFDFIVSSSLFSEFFKGCCNFLISFFFFFESFRLWGNFLLSHVVNINILIK